MKMKAKHIRILIEKSAK